MDATGGSLVLRDLSEEVIGAFFDTYNELGHGFMESVYEAALVIRLHESGLLVERQVPSTFASTARLLATSTRTCCLRNVC